MTNCLQQFLETQSQLFPEELLTSLLEGMTVKTDKERIRETMGTESYYHFVFLRFSRLLWWWWVLVFWLFVCLFFAKINFFKGDTPNKPSCIQGEESFVSGWKQNRSTWYYLPFAVLFPNKANAFKAGSLSADFSVLQDWFFRTSFKVVLKFWDLGILALWIPLWRQQ